MLLMLGINKDLLIRFFDIVMVLAIVHLWPMAKEGFDLGIRYLGHRPDFVECSSSTLPAAKDNTDENNSELLDKELDSSGEAIDLTKHEGFIFSQNGEDGVLQKIFEIIEPTSRYAVEFGASDGITGSNVRNLFINKGWSGFLIEAGEERFGKLQANYKQTPQVKLLRTFVYPGNIEILFEDNNVPKDLDLLVIDIDSNDYYVWRAVHDYRPKVVLIEYNPSFAPPVKAVVEYNPLTYWDGSDYYGASIQSLYELGKRKGYELLFAESSGTNLFFVDKKYFDRFGIQDNSPKTLYKPPTYGVICGGRAPNGRGHPVYESYTDLWGLRKPYAGDLVYNKVRVEKKMVYGR